MLTNFHQPCPCGKSSDAFAHDDKGAGYCFSGFCERKNRYFSKEELKSANMDTDHTNTSSPVAVAELQLPAGSEFSELSDRRLSLETCRTYGVKVSRNEVGAINKHYYPYFNSEGTCIALKARVLPKSFFVSGDLSNSMLFGQQLKKRSKYITICEGELDALAAYQMMGSKYPVVSVRAGAAAAANECRKQYEYLSSFEQIYLCFDADPPGAKAAREVAEIFPGKAKIVSLMQYKDPCEYLINNKAEDFVSEWWKGELYTPDNVLYGEKLIAECRKPLIPGRDLIWSSLTLHTRGIRPHELWAFGAGTGMGKSEFFKEIAYGLLSQGETVGMFMLEEPPSRTAKSIVGKELNKRIYLEGVSVADAELEAAEKKLLASNQLIVYDHKGMSDFENIRSKIDYFVSGLGCKYIFLDHITAMAEGKLEQEGAVNSRCHYIMEELARMVQAKPFSIFFISHLRKANGQAHEEGGRVHLDDLYGSGAIKQRSHFVFGIEGNLQGSEFERNVRYLRFLKDRDAGVSTGRVINLLYSHDTGRLKEFDGTLETGVVQ